MRKLWLTHWSQNIGTVTFSGCGKYSAFYTPWAAFPAQKSCSQQFLTDPCFPGQIGKREFLTLKKENLICNSIIGLFLFGGPTTIARFVISGIILTLNCMIFAWAWSHIFKETNKTEPVLDQRNSSFLVMQKGWIRWLRTTRDHISPRRISRRNPTFPSMTMPWFCRHTYPSKKLIIHGI